MQQVLNIAGLLACVVGILGAFTLFGLMVENGYKHSGAISTGWLWSKGGGAPRDPMRETAVDYLRIQGYTRAAAEIAYDEWKARQG